MTTYLLNPSKKRPQGMTVQCVGDADERYCIRDMHRKVVATNFATRKQALNWIKEGMPVDILDTNVTDKRANVTIREFKL
jgi:hypothetical protein